jgi:hypothetical protein
MRISKTPKKLDSICCPQCRETNTDTLKRLRPIGEGDQELEKNSQEERQGRRTKEGRMEEMRKLRKMGE